jgi:hypothetical protein
LAQYAYGKGMSGGKDTSKMWDWYNGAAALMSKSAPSTNENGYWGFSFVASKSDASATPWNTDGFAYTIFPEGQTGGQLVLVTCRIDRLAESDFTSTALTGKASDLFNKGVYNPDAGYEVYYFGM